MNTTDEDRNRCEAPEQPVPCDDDDLPAAKKARLEGPTLWQRIIAWLPWLSGPAAMTRL